MYFLKRSLRFQNWNLEVCIIFFRGFPLLSNNIKGSINGKDNEDEVRTIRSWIGNSQEKMELWKEKRNGQQNLFYKTYLNRIKKMETFKVYLDFPMKRTYRSRYNCQEKESCEFYKGGRRKTENPFLRCR